jgi:hypothetical protein
MPMRYFSASAEGLSLSGGASIRHLRFFKLSITSRCRGAVALETTKATRPGRLAKERSCR